MDKMQIKFLLNDLAFNSSEKALKSLYGIYHHKIIRYLTLFVKSEEAAEELTSDVFFTIWENRQKLLEIDRFDAYIYRIAKFKALNYLRDQKTINVSLNELDIDLFTNTRTTIEDEYISNELIDTINQAVEQLPSQSKLAFKLVREDNMKYKDAAEHMGISVKTLEAHLTAAVKKIRKILRPEFGKK